MKITKYETVAPSMQQLRNLLQESVESRRQEDANPAL